MGWHDSSSAKWDERGGNKNAVHENKEGSRAEEEQICIPIKGGRRKRGRQGREMFKNRLWQGTGCERSAVFTREWGEVDRGEDERDGDVMRRWWREGWGGSEGISGSTWGSAGASPTPRQQPATTSVKSPAAPRSPPPSSGPNLLDVVILKNGQ